MSVISFLGIIIFILGFAYAFLGLLAYQTIKEKDKTFHFSFPLWFLNKDIYNEHGQFLCRFGLPLFVLTWIGAIVWFVLK